MTTTSGARIAVAPPSNARTMPFASGHAARTSRAQRTSASQVLPGSYGELRVEASRSHPVDRPKAPRCLHEIFEAQADKTPDAIALECGDRSYSYGDVEREANRLARYLVVRGIGVGSFVGLSLDRSEWPVIAILAVLKAGAAYVPIEPSLPNDRIRYIAEAASLAAIITNAHHQARLSEIVDAEVLTVDGYRLQSAGIAADRLSQFETSVHQEDICYVLFTSGTTGRPKGVVTEHRNVVHFVSAFNEVCATSSYDRVFQGFSLGFDGSVEEIWMAFSNGATLVCGDAETPRFGAELAAFLDEKKITFLSTVPTLLTTLPHDIASLMQLVVSGEACHVDLVNRWAHPGRLMLNVYGPTEATVNTTAAVLNAGAPVTIGKPLAGYEIHILDADLRPVAKGEKGELYIGGAGISRGYLGQPELTARSYIDWSLSSHDGGTAREDTQRLYKAGDLVRWNDDGELEFFGRIDNQIKIRGFRVELSEIEAVLLEQPGIAAAVVKVHEETGLQQLAAYVLRSSRTELDRGGVLAALRDRLPAYMVPTYLDALEAFPRLASGKVDRGQLPAPKHPLVNEDAATAADMSPLEARVAAVWAKQLGLSAVGPEQNFFTDLGGHSLVAAGLANALRTEFGVRVPVRDIYSHPTVRALAALFDTAEAQAQPDSGSPRPAAVGVTPKRPWYTTVLQVLYLVSVMPVLALPAVYVLPLAMDVLQRRGSMAEFAVLLLGVAAATWASLILLAIVAKWTIIGRYRPGRYPMWGGYYVRWWIVSRLQHLSHISVFNGTPLAPLLWRAFGAKVGKRCYINASLIYAWDCVRLGDDVSIGADTQLPGFRVEGGEMIVGTVDIGDRCFVGCHSVLGLGVRMGDESKLDDQSMLADGCEIPDGVAYRGSPAVRANVLAPFGQPVQFGGFRLAVFGCLQLVLGAATALLTLAPLAAGAGLAAMLAINYSVSVWVPAFFILVPTSLFLFALWAAFCKRIVQPFARVGLFELYSWHYLEHWLAELVMQIVKTVGRPIFTTIYLPPWMRLLGARLGCHTEMSTVWRVDPDMLVAGDGVFFADGCIIGSTRVHLGQFLIARNEIGNGSFIGNSAILPSGAIVGDNCLLGVLSAPPDPFRPIPDNTDWLGSPGFQLPNRQKVTGFDPRLTYTPSRKLYLQRALIDSLRVLIPGYVLAGIGIVSLLTILSVYETYGSSGAYTAMLLLTWAAILVCLATVIGAKWLVMGRFKPVVTPLWSSYVWWNEMVNGLYESLMAPLVTNFFGTPIASLLMRTLGCKVGKYCYIESALFSEFDLIEIGDHVALNAGSIVQNHLFEDRVMKSSSLLIADGCTVGNMSVVLYDTVMEPHAVLKPLSLLMKGERMPAGRHWQGSPTVEVCPSSRSRDS